MRLIWERLYLTVDLFLVGFVGVAVYFCSIGHQTTDFVSLGVCCIVFSYGAFPVLFFSPRVPDCFLVGLLGVERVKFRRELRIERVAEGRLWTEKEEEDLPVSGVDGSFWWEFDFGRDGRSVRSLGSRLAVLALNSFICHSSAVSCGIPEVAKMPRSFKGYIASASTGLLAILNVGIVIAAVATIVIEIYLERPPSRIGWCFLGVGIISIIAGLCGIRATKSVGCFSWHLIALLFSVGGLIAAGLVIFIKVDQVLKNMDLTKSGKDSKTIVRLLGAIFFIMGCVQGVILVLAIIASCCEFVDYYEDLEMANRGAGLHGMAEESAKRVDRKQDSKASQLAEKMKTKYGKWARDGEFGAN